MGRVTVVVPSGTPEPQAVPAAEPDVKKSAPRKQNQKESSDNG